jgi:hypothetical protein
MPKRCGSCRAARARAVSRAYYTAHAQEIKLRAIARAEAAERRAGA